MPPLRYACEFTTSGYSVAAWRLLRALLAVGVDVAWQPLVDLREGRVVPPEGTELPAALAPLQRDRVEGETVVVHAVPKGWRLGREQLRPARMVGHTVWEADVVPRRWLVDMEPADELWVPTTWNQRAFQEAFDVPVHVVPHIATAQAAEPPPFEVPDDVFVVAVVSAWDWRKRPDRAVEAYARAFRRTDPVLLVVKTTPFPIAWPQRQGVATVAHLAELLRRFPDHGRVHVDTADWTDGQLLGLLTRADCSLSLTAAEGWGLGAFDAACRGTPVLITGHGGQVEWLGADHPGLLPHRLVDAVHPDTTLFEPGMQWAEADLDAVVELLRELRRGGLPELRAATERLARDLPARYSAEVVGTRAAALLR